MSEFIGSVISLISKRDIRYKGTLHAINSENHTVALENVYSFGTEGRRNGVDEVPPQDELYEYIVFRGTDVKELSIEEPPAPSKPSLASQDPAIVQTRRPSPPVQNSTTQAQPAESRQGPNQGPGPASNSAQYQGYSQFNPSYSPGPDPQFASGQYSARAGYQYPQYPSQQTQARPGPPSQAPRGPTSQDRQYKDQPAGPKPVELGSFDTYCPDDGGFASIPGGPENPGPSDSVAPAQSSKSHVQPRKILQRNENSGGPAELPTQSSYGRQQYNPARAGREEYGRQGGPNPNGNWENANAKYQELALSEKPMNVIAAHAEAEVADKPSTSEIKPPAYDRGKSFFDNISSDLGGRQDGRDRQFRDTERRKNLETFGQGSVDTHRARGGFHRGRNRGRGGTGGPGFRPRGRNPPSNVPTV